MPPREVVFYEFDDFRLDLRKRALSKGGEPVALTHKAFQVLQMLLQNAEQTVDKETIYTALWADSFVEDANLTQHIYVLRKALGSMPSGDSYIETVARSGYRFAAPVKAIYQTPLQRVPASAESGRVVEETGDPTVTQAADERAAARGPDDSAAIPKTASPPSSSVFGRRGIVIGVCAVAVIAIAGIYYFLWRPPAGGPAPTARSIAVLPFKPIGEESQNEKLGFGMADAIITRVSKLQRIPIRPTSSVIRYADAPPESSLTAGKDMGVDAVLEGTVQRENERVRVSVKLLNVADGTTIWAENFDENYTGGVFAVQDSISLRVVQALEVNLTPQEEKTLARWPTLNAEAFQAYQMGVYFGNKRSREDLSKAAGYFERAIELDPKFAKAYAMLADTHNMLRYYGFADRVESRAKTLAAVRKAMELDPTIAESYIALSNLIWRGPSQQPLAKRLLEHAIEFAPYNSTARLRYGWVILEEDIDAAEQQMRLAQEYDPLSGVSNGALCNVVTYREKYDEAIKYCEKAVELTPEAASNRILLADAYFLAGRHAEAIEQANKRIAETEGREHRAAIGTLGLYYAKMGRTADAEKIVTELRPTAGEEPNLYHDLTLISFELGKDDEGLRFFEELLKSPPFPVASFRYHPYWRNIRQDERIERLFNSRFGERRSPPPNNRPANNRQR